MLTPTNAIYRFGQFEVKAASGELFKDGKRVRLQEQPFRLLIVLLENAGEVVTREELRSCIWPENTFVDFEGSLRVAVRKLREALDDDADSPRYIETIPKRGYRFLSPAVHPAGAAAPIAVTTGVAATGVAAAEITATEPRTARIRSSRWILSAVVLVGIVAAAGWLLRNRHRKIPNERDTVVLADFVNTTGDPVFDETLRQGLAVQLEQSPFLSLISDQSIQQTLRLMGQPADAQLTPELAYNLCQRTQSAAVINGSIANLGSQYIVGLKAVNCRNGDSLGEEQEIASGKEQVLTALDTASVKLRQRLGESLSSVQRFETPLPEATTSSLDALQAFAQGEKVSELGEYAATIPFFQRAITLDPNFALAYAALGSVYSFLGETNLSVGYVRKAYDLRARVTEKEKLFIESSYYHYVTGDLERTRQVYELEARTYPHDNYASVLLWLLYSQIGQLDNALAAIRESIRFDSPAAADYGQLVASYTYLNRLSEARAAAQQALADGYDSYPVRIQLYRLAFLDNDKAGMDAQVKWGAGKPGVEDEFIEQEADTAAYFAHVSKSREFSRQAIASAIQAQKQEKSAVFEGRAALREALFGNMKESRLHASSAWGSTTPREAQYAAIFAFARAGDSVRAEHLADEFSKRFPEDTLVELNYLPTVYAQIALNRGQPAKAIEILRRAAPYELAAITVPIYMCPVYVRGSAYLASHQGTAAASEFQKIIDHRGIVRNDIVGALAHLQLGRAYAMSGDEARAKSAYRDFLDLWKDADPGVPVLKQARAEYAKLR